MMVVSMNSVGSSHYQEDCWITLEMMIPPMMSLYFPSNKEEILGLNRSKRQYRPFSIADIGHICEKAICWCQPLPVHPVHYLRRPPANSDKRRSRWQEGILLSLSLFLFESWIVLKFVDPDERGVNIYGFKSLEPNEALFDKRREARAMVSA